MWYSGIVLNCWSTGCAIDPAPGALFMTKFILFAQVAPAQYSLRSAASWPKTPFIFCSSRFELMTQASCSRSASRSLKRVSCPERISLQCHASLATTKPSRRESSTPQTAPSGTRCSSSTSSAPLPNYLTR